MATESDKMNSYLVTLCTAPRKNPTIHQTLESLRQCGIGSNVHIFAEPGSELPTDDHVVIHQNLVKLGGFANHLQAMIWARNAHVSERVICLDDDVLFCRSFLQKIHEQQSALLVGLTHEWTVKQHHTYLQGNSGWIETIPEFGANNIHGAQCYVFSRECLKSILTSSVMLDYISLSESGISLPFYDNIICASAFSCQIPIMLHIPSLCQHNGIWSYIFKPDDPDDPLKDRRGYLFDGE